MKTNKSPTQPHLENLYVNVNFTRILISASLLAALSSAHSVLAAEPAAKHQKHNVVSRQSERVKTDNGFTRTTSKRMIRVPEQLEERMLLIIKRSVRVPDMYRAPLLTVSLTGQSTAQKTDTGYGAQGQLTTSGGKVIDRLLVPKLIKRLILSLKIFR